MLTLDFTPDLILTSTKVQQYSLTLQDRRQCLSASVGYTSKSNGILVVSNLLSCCFYQTYCSSIRILLIIIIDNPPVDLWQIKKISLIVTVLVTNNLPAGLQDCGFYIYIHVYITHTPTSMYNFRCDIHQQDPARPQQKHKMGGKC